ncbi:MAG: zinc ribbon domain-containing protein [Erysipelotrichaceae bacterium]|nr:zinc ribbon domain-containing protein [Erysipelotrichaceae bacterium]
MGMFDDLKKKVVDTSDKAVNKTKDWSDTSKLNSTINAEQKKIDNNYYHIGKLYATMHVTDYEDDFAGMMNEIQASQAIIRDCKEQIKQIKGVVICENCDTENPLGATYCSKCGKELPKSDIDTENMVKCSNPACGKYNPKGMRFCTGCGQPLVEVEKKIEYPAKKICPNPECGFANNPENGFCEECGTKL